LKLMVALICTAGWLVAPRAGAWIETSEKESSTRETLRRPPRGGVD